MNLSVRGGAPVRPRSRLAAVRVAFAERRLLLGLMLVVSLLGSPALAVEEPAFRTVARAGAFEVRDYPALTVAEVTVPGSQGEAANRGFRLLAGYIFGGNKGRRSIAMTAPVALEPVGETLGATGPVTRTRTAGGWIVRFTMPAASTLETLPEPNDARVRLRRAPAVRLAVLRFSGLTGRGAVDARSRELLAEAAARRWRPTGPVTLAQYDPPWTLWFLRRNEVMVPVEANP